VCRSQRALLNVLSKKSRESACRQSTAWTDDNEECATLTESVSYTSLTGSNKSVMGLRNSRSAGNLTSNRPSVSTDLDSIWQGRTVMTAGITPLVAGSSSSSSRRPVTGLNTSSDKLSSEHCDQRRPGVTVDVELLSNWGHERLVGLTEIELLDVSERRIEIEPSADVTLLSASASSTINEDCRRRVDALFSGKCKVGVCYHVCKALMLRCQCPSVCPSVCDGSALAPYS